MSPKHPPLERDQQRQRHPLPVATPRWVARPGTTCVESAGQPRDEVELIEFSQDEDRREQRADQVKIGERREGDESKTLQVGGTVDVGGVTLFPAVCAGH